MDEAAGVCLRGRFCSVTFKHLQPFGTQGAFKATAATNLPAGGDISETQELASQRVVLLVADNRW